MIDVMALDGADGFRLFGNSPQRSGQVITGGADFNGDGFDDIVVGSPYVASGNAGMATLILGQADGFEPASVLAFPEGVTRINLTGEDSDDRLGQSVAFADFDGDGLADLLIGSRLIETGALTDNGAVYLLRGDSTPTAANKGVDDFSASAIARIDGPADGDGFGFRTAGLGDVNGDGFADIAVGSPGADANGLVNKGAVTVLFGGGDLPAVQDVPALGGDGGFRIDAGPASSDFLFSGAQGAGDVNGDGYADLIAKGGAATGVAHVIFGGPDLVDFSIDSLDGADGFTLSSAGGVFATEVAGAGDLNGDGFDDIAVSSIGYDFQYDQNGVAYSRDNAGAAFVLFGDAGARPADVDVATLDGTDGFVIVGAAAGDTLGRSVAAAGDFNGDGFDDLIVGARTTSDVGAVIVFGGADGFQPVLDLADLGDAGLALDVSGVDTPTDNVIVSGAGDMNGDGFEDVAISIVRGAEGGGEVGLQFFVFGRAAGGVSVFKGVDGDHDGGLGGSGANVLGLGDDNFEAGAGARSVRGGGGNDSGVFSASNGDRFFGGAGDDAADGGAGGDFLYGEAGDDVLTLGAGAGADLAYGGAGDDVVRAQTNELGAGDRLHGGIGLADELHILGSGAVDLATLDLIAGFEIVHVGAGAAVTSASDSGMRWILGAEGGLGASVTLGAGDDDVAGGAGDDTIAGGAGADTIAGGNGFDLADYRADAAGVVVDLAAGQATDGAGDMDTLTGVEGAIGSAHADVLMGDGGDNRLAGGAGADMLDGGAGVDVADYALDGAGVVVNLITGVATDGAGDTDALASIEGAVGSAHADTLVGDAGANSLSGGDGADRLDGRGGDDTLAGGAGDDIYTVDSAGDVVIEADDAGGADRINVHVDFVNPDHVEFLVGRFATVGLALTGNAARDRITGSNLINSADRIAGEAGNDRLVGLVGDDVIEGGAGHDRLFGNSGDDVLTGGAGRDILTGQFGADRFVFAPGAGDDLITDFEDGVDLIDLAGYGFADFANDVAPTIFQDGVSAVIALGDDSITLKGVSATALDADDFILG